MLRKIIFAGTLMVLAFNSLLVVAQDKNFNLIPKAAVAGKSVTVNYNPKGTALEGKKNITATIYQFCNYQWKLNNIVLEKKDSLWTSSYSLPENASFVAFKFKSGSAIDIGQTSAYGWLLVGEDGKNLSGAYAGWAFLRNASVPELYPDFTKDKFLIGDDVVLYWMEQQLRYYPSSKRDIFYPHLKVLKKVDTNKARKAAVRDIAYMKTLPDLTEKDLVNIKKVYSEILERPASADSMARVIASIDSGAIRAKNPEKLAAFKAMGAERDYKKLLPMTISFLEQFPMDKADRAFDLANRIDYSKFYSTIAIIASVEKDSVTFKKYVAHAPFASLANVFYKCMKVPYVSLKSFSAAEAYIYARPMMNRLLQFNELKPDGFIDVYMDNAGVYADILMHLNKDAEALGFAGAAQQKYEYGNSPLNEVSAILLERSGQLDKLKLVLESSMKKNQMTPLMLNMLKKNYVLLHKSDKGYDAYLASLKDVTLDAALEEKVRKSMIKKVLPEFSVKNNKGKLVKLSDQKGKVVVLDFWASWCAPCKAAFPGMKMAVEKYKDDKDVVFFFVDTQENRKDYEAYVMKYLKDNNYDFEVLFDADANLSKSFGVGPIPHKMVIDKNGALRFSEVGYMGSPSELVDEIGMMVELARKGE
jgi:thiol-disulfide isomerase/thioredoxin